MASLDRHRHAALLAAEQRRFSAANGASRALFERAKRSLHNGVPMPWMTQWASPHLSFIEEATGARARAPAGPAYIAFSLGCTAAPFCLPPRAVSCASAAAGRGGMTFMLPTEDSIHVGEALAARFGLPHWQFALSATDANRFAIKIARAVTGRRRVLIFNGCYHGSIDDTLATLYNGVLRPGPPNMGTGADPPPPTRPCALT